MTAIAAVIALSSVSAFAQNADVPVDPTATPVIESAPVAADPLAPAETTVAAEPVAAKATSRRATSAKSAAARSRPAPARATASAPRVTASPAAAIAAPVAVAPAIEQPLPPPTEVAAEPIAQAPATATNIDLLPTAGLGGIGLLALVGGALAFRSRRKRRAEEAAEAEWLQQQAEAEPAADVEPAMAVEPEPELVLTAPAPAVASTSEPTPASGAKFIGPVADLPEGFDLSRFGPNVQDAYRGPTEDNPSASLRHRLSRASGMDQQERKLSEEVEAVTGEPILDEADTVAPAEAPAAKPAAADPVRGDFIFARGNKKPSPALTP